MRIVKWLLPALLLIAALGYYWFTKEQANLVASLVVNKMLENMHADGDGALTEQEGLTGMFSLFDANGDGIAERAELLAVIVRSTRPFRWSNPPAQGESHAGLTHATFHSQMLDQDVGYNIYLPASYFVPANDALRYPVIYYLHGGRPGNESLSVALAKPIHAAIEAAVIRPAIIVWVNGGKVSHYNYDDSPGEDVFVHELIPHIDATYRTIAKRGGRALQGFSQGGRGTTRIMFKYPELFVSAAPGGAGYAVELQIQANDGIEVDTRQGPDTAALDFGAGNDAYSLAEKYAHNPSTPPLQIMLWGGERGFNYRAVVAYLGFLHELGIPAEQLFAPAVDHNPMRFYQDRGAELLRFHDRHWQDGTSATTSPGAE